MSHSMSATATGLYTGEHCKPVDPLVLIAMKMSDLGARMKYSSAVVKGVVVGATK